MTDFHDRKTMERRHQHLARADRELGAAQHFLHPGSAKEAEMDIVHAVAAARFAATTALERVRSWLEEPEAKRESLENEYRRGSETHTAPSIVA